MSLQPIRWVLEVIDVEKQVKNVVVFPHDNPFV